MKFAAAFLIAALLALSVYRVATGRFTLSRDAPLVSPAPTVVTTKPTRKVLVVVLDGLRADAVELVPSLRDRREHGAVASLEADLPTISAAQYTSLLTGATPQTSGRRGNDALTPVKLDSVPDLVRRAGGRTAVFSDGVDWWWLLFPDAFDAREASLQFQPALELARGGYDFVVVHLCAFDDAGHALGAAHPSYRVGAALQVEWKLAALRAAWGDAGPVLVTSDHGHRDSGGHGGGEPEVTGTFALLDGPGVANDGRAKGRVIDVAPTLAALMGLPAPSGSEGRTLTGLLELGDDERRRIEAADVARIGPLLEQAERRRLGLEAGQDVSRALRGGSALAVLLLVSALVRSQRRAAATGFVAGLGALVLGCAAYFVFIGAVSPSSARGFALLVQYTALIGLIVGVLALLPVMRLREGRSHALLAAAAGSSVLTVWMYTAFGIAAPRVSITSAWAIALPSLAWAGWAGVLAVLLLGT
ncbi:MAG: alkaline phosphatase family protein, partial [Myxococcaceae bacterium]|nr:alkaline phosphatase family protein [Myxococcaceae bacterium]